MFSAVQILLMIVVVVLTGLSLVLGVQVFKLVKQLRQTVKEFRFFLKKIDSEDFLSRLSALTDSEEFEDRPSPRQDPSVSVGLRFDSKKAPSRSFYRRGRNLS